MKKILLPIMGVMLSLIAPTLFAQSEAETPQGVSIVRTLGTHHIEWQLPMAAARFMQCAADGDSVYFAADTLRQGFPLNELTSVTLCTPREDISITYGATGISIVNPYALRGVDISIGVDNAVVVHNTLDTKLNYVLSGEGFGSFKLYSIKKQDITLQDLHLTSKDGPALNIQTGKSSDIKIKGNNVLCDSKTYTPCGEEDMKACIFSEGQLIFKGSGTLEVAGLYKHAICSDDYIQIEKGSIHITQAPKDGIHSNDYFEMLGGTLIIEGTGDDCIDGGTVDATDAEKDGHILISGGEMTLSTATDDTKAIKCEGKVTIAGDANVKLNIAGMQSKGISTDSDISIAGGTIVAEATGDAVVTDGDVGYCTVLKADGDISISGGNIHIKHSGKAGKGISVDGNATITGGVIQIEVSGGGDTYTNASNEEDTYSATCIKVDGRLDCLAGQLTLLASGSGGKGISVDGVSLYGERGDHTALNVNVTTTGPKITTSGSGRNPWWTPSAQPMAGPGGHEGGPGGGPGFGQDGTGGNPKAIKSEGDLTVNGGVFTITTQQDGGEGIESKATLTINDGELSIETYDDGLNAGKALIINGGKVYCASSGNDGIDSNGTIDINGGYIISCGTTQPEESFDCDNNRFAVTGGIFVGFAGGVSRPTASACKQCVASMSAGASPTITYTVTNNDGEYLMSFASPKSYSRCTTVFSHPAMQQGVGIKVYTGGTLQGGDTFHGLTTDATYVPGTLTKSFTVSSMYQTIY